MPHAVVVLPAGCTGSDAEAPDRRWLARARHRRDEGGGEVLQRILETLDVEPPAGGLGALRLWGEAGEAPGDWVAAADPVYLEARLDHVYLFALAADEVPPEDLAEIFAFLQAALGSNGSEHVAFTRVGAHGYLHSDRPMATAQVSPRTVDGASPDVYLPEDSSTQSHDRLLSEVQMCLHESEVNRRRVQAGLRPVNSLWFWGGGRAEPRVRRVLPPLYADVPLVRGYWHSSDGTVCAWPGSFGACLDASPEGFVAVVPDAPRGMPAAGGAAYLGSLHRLLSRGRLQTLVLLFQDGLKVHFRRSDRFRFWRRGSDLSPEADRR
jgi:hypothetical protein